MLTDIFSSFDPFVFNSILPSTNMFIIINLLIINILNTSFWMSTARKTSPMIVFTSIIMSQLSRTFMFSIKGMSTIITPLFSLIIFINLLGIIPYMFSTSSHLIFTLTLGLPLWLSMILSSFTKAPKASVAHFLPDGAPDWLNPFLVLIETTSIMVRPATLSFRLAANMSAGHIVLSLVGVYCATAWFSSISTLSILLMITVGYILFEVAICMIQAYIFCLLLSLYSDDHAH